MTTAGLKKHSRYNESPGRKASKNIEVPFHHELFEDPRADGGVGPHVINVVLTALGLASQTNGGVYSQVKRIARFTRW